MDKKAEFIFKHYKECLEKRTFDEYDILGFLIFMREYIKNDKTRYKYINDFADLVAHRERNRGIIMDCIKTAIANEYQTEEDSKQIKGYNGMNYEDWVNEWIVLGKAFGITLTEKIILEITLCVFSLCQDTIYDDKKGCWGKIALWQSLNGYFSLTTTEGNKYSLHVCFAKCGSFDMKYEFPVGKINVPVETYRENGELHLRTSDIIIM